MKRKLVLILSLGLGVVLACSKQTSDPTADLPSDPAQYPAEQAVVAIPITEPLAQRDAEVSGMAWYGDYLIMLPQYPRIFGPGDEGIVFALPKSDILGYLDGDVSGPLEPIQIAFVESGLSGQIDGFQGYEAIGFVGDQVFLTVEAGSGDDMAGYLVAGSIAPDLSVLQLDASNFQEIPQPVNIDNKADETLIITDETVVTMYEINGAEFNSAPVAHVFGLDMVSQGTIAFPNVEYRITDASGLDEAGRFWAINYFFTGSSKIKPEVDPLVEAYGEGYTHAQNEGVERLVEFELGDAGVTLVEGAPIQLELGEDERNWEGLVRLDGRGFLVMTDKFPETVLGFVVAP